MILANYAQQNRNTVREIGLAFTNPFALFKPAFFPNIAVEDAQAGTMDLSAFNHGYNPPYSWALPMKSGGLASTLQIVGVGTISGDALAVKLAEAAISGSGTLEGVGSLIVQAIAALSGSGTISNADLKAFLQAVAAISGSGTVSAASLTGLGELICALTGMGTTAGSTASGTGELTADLVVTGTGLSTANVGQAVWEFIVENGLTAEDVMRILLAVNAGQSTGGGTTEITFRDQADTKDRVVATVDSSGNRSALTIDPD
jgi:hypothetical protein